MVGKEGYKRKNKREAGQSKFRLRVVKVWCLVGLPINGRVSGIRSKAKLLWVHCLKIL